MLSLLLCLLCKYSALGNGDRLLPCHVYSASNERVWSLVGNRAGANALLPTYVTTCLYFGGLFIVFAKIPKGWMWYSWTSFMRYSWTALMLDNYRDTELAKVPVFFDSHGNPQTVLEFYGMTEGVIMTSVGACLGLLCVLLTVFTALGALAVVYIRHDKR